jgi:hypothetical protein
MPEIIESGRGSILPGPSEKTALSRRKFLGIGAAATFLVVGVTACDKDDDNNQMPQDGIDLGSGDFGILNYAYALEQLEAAFYTKLIESPYSSMPAAEMALLKDIRDHEIAHREFFKNALGSNAIKALTPDFSKIDFSNRTAVLGAAKTFEDLGVSAYNGAGKLITNGAYLTIAGKIVSVEARHAAYIRDLISNGSFAADTDANGMDKALDPATVLTAANTYLTTKVTGKNLPTS